MISFNSAELYTLIAGFLWPLARILGLLAAAPLFGNRSVPARVKLAFGVLLGLLIAPTVPAVPALDPMSLTGLMILAQQMIIGLAMGFSMRVVFAAIEMAGEIIGMTMGLGFATFFDPQSQGRSSAISQLLALVTLMIFLAANFHLVMISVLVESFISMPISGAPLGTSGFQQVAYWGGLIFSAGVQLALPIIAALLINNIALGILTRASPQLNLFGIGFPIAIGVGFIMIAVCLPYLAVPIEKLLHEGAVFIQQLAGVVR